MVIHDLILIHHFGANVDDSLPKPTAVSSEDRSPVHLSIASSKNASSPPKVEFEMKTCLRQVTLMFGASGGFGAESFGAKCSASEGREVLYGKAAYIRTLEIICGLESPLFGETEVFGQFKDAVQKFTAPSAYWQSRFRKVFQRLLADAKQVRKLHLSSVGSQSYGSVVRGEVRGMGALHILGSGHLVGEMLPWLTKVEAQPVYVYARNLERARMQLGELATRVRLRSFNEVAPAESITDSGVLVVAVPLTAAEIVEWVTKHNFAVSLIIDLRSDSDRDPIALLTKAAPQNEGHLGKNSGTSRGGVLNLKNVFARIAANKDQHQIYRVKALNEIQNLASVRAMEIECRPFGWEDLCAL